MTGKTDVMSILEEMNTTPAEVAASLQEFSESARALSSNHPHLVDDYPDKWIAVFRGTVHAHGDTLDEVLAKVDEEGIPRSEVIIRLIEREPRTFIL